MEKRFTNLEFHGSAESPTAPLTISPSGVVYGFNGQDTRQILQLRGTNTHLPSSNFSCPSERFAYCVTLVSHLLRNARSGA